MQKKLEDEEHNPDEKFRKTQVEMEKTSNGYNSSFIKQTKLTKN